VAPSALPGGGEPRFCCPPAPRPAGLLAWAASPAAPVVGTRAGAEPPPRQGSRQGAELRPPAAVSGMLWRKPSLQSLLPWPGCLLRPREGTTQPSDSPDLVPIRVAAGQLPGRVSCGRQRPARPLEEGVVFVFGAAEAQQPPFEISTCSALVRRFLPGPVCPVAAGDHGHVLRPPQVRCGPPSPAAVAPGCAPGSAGSWGGPVSPGCSPWQRGARSPPVLRHRSPAAAPAWAATRVLARAEPREPKTPPASWEAAGNPPVLAETPAPWCSLLAQGVRGGREPWGRRVSVPSERFVSLEWPLQLPRALAKRPRLPALTALPALPQALQAAALFCFVLFRWCCRTQGSPDNSGHKNFFRKLRNLPVNP